MICLGVAPVMGQDPIGPGLDGRGMALAVRHLFDLQRRVVAAEITDQAVHGAAVVLLPPLCLAGSEHRQLPRPLAALGDAGHPRLHFRRRAAGVVGPAAEQHQVAIGRASWWGEG
ncbi:hypothetical protein G6F23_015005 [Rhizopus arrhizus]|nr:hypothetical protein G6F23_015005 [Rhizopus arrhizus]